MVSTTVSAENMLFTGSGLTIAKWLPGVSLVMSAVQTGQDLAKAYSSYQNCMAGN